MTEAEKLLIRLSKQAKEIESAIERRQLDMSGRVSKAERQLFLSILDEIVPKLEFTNGLVDNSVKNLLLLYRLDRVFESWQNEVFNPVMSEFVKDLFSISDMTTAYYEGMAAEKIINGIAESNELLRAAIGVDSDGKFIKGSILSDISTVPTVRQEMKSILVQAVQSNSDLKDLNKVIKEFIQGKKGQNGAINTYFNSKASGYAYDLYNRVAEVKNEQFRDVLDLQWFIYSGDVIKDSRDFCRKKAGKVFAVIEADTEWKDDPDLIGKSSGIPYIPRVDRGRWRCRHRIRYITRETAMRLDPKKVEQIEQSYGVIDVKN